MRDIIASFYSLYGITQNSDLGFSVSIPKHPPSTPALNLKVNIKHLAKVLR